MDENLLDLWVVPPSDSTAKDTKNTERKSIQSDILLLEIAKKAYRLENVSISRDNRHHIPRILSKKREIFTSVSHSHHWTFLAFSDQRVGVDGECVCCAEKEKMLGKIMPIAQKYFSQQEWQVLRQQEDQKKIQTFFQWWTAKEAFVKSARIYLLTGIRQEIRNIPPQWSWQYFHFNQKKLQTFLEKDCPTTQKILDKSFIALTLMWQRHPVKEKTSQKDVDDLLKLRFYPREIISEQPQNNFF